MGIGFVLLMYLIAGLILASIIGAVRSNHSRRGGEFGPVGKRSRFSIRPFLLPVGLLLYAGVAFIFYAMWCEGVRHVDPRVGDLWHVPLSNGYSFVMRDVTTQAEVNDAQGFPAVTEVREIAQYGNIIYGVAPYKGRHFVIDTATNQKWLLLNTEEFQAKARSLSIPGVDPLPVQAFYDQQRGLFWDAFALAVIITIPWVGLRMNEKRRWIALTRRPAAPAARRRPPRLRSDILRGKPLSSVQSNPE